MKLTDAVLDFLTRQGVEQCFAVTGGAAAHIFDSLKNSKIKTVHMHHEQACAMAADGYARISGKPALVVVTNGPGVSNAITGVLGAYQDSIPMIIISGQVPTNQMIHNSGGAERQYGVQEVETQALVTSIVKYFTTLTSEEDLDKKINYAWNVALSGRPGPVWIEIPLNIQIREVSPIKPDVIRSSYEEYAFDETLVALSKAERPVIIIGGGVHSACAESEIINFATTTGIPVISTWGANDVFNVNSDLYIGNFGILGNRTPNIAVQKADLLLVLGSRLSIPNTGYETKLFSPDSLKIMVNVDRSEMNKSAVRIDLPINQDLKNWLRKFPINKLQKKQSWNVWVQKLKSLETMLSLDSESSIHESNSIDAYEVIKQLSKHIPTNAILVTDMGTSFTCTMQAFRNSNNVRLFTSSGTSSMGFGLPGAIGAYFADSNRSIFLIAGDGGFQMNIQELQTVKFHNIPITILLLNSNGYLAISIMQQNLFNGNYIGSNPESGIDAPEFSRVADAFGLASKKVHKLKHLVREIKSQSGSKRARLIEIAIPKNQVMRPRSQSLRSKDGSIYSQGIEIMWPYLNENQISNIDSILE